MQQPAWQNEDTDLWPALVALSHVASAAGSVDQIYDAFADTVKRFVSYDRLIVRLIDEEPGMVTNVYVAGAQIDGWAPGRTHELGDTITGEVVATGRPILIRDSRVHPLAKTKSSLQETAAEFPAFLAIPLISRGRVLGTLQLRSRTPGAFVDSDVNVLQEIAVHITPAIENALHMKDLNHEAHERQVMLELGRIITSSLDIDSVFERFASLMSQVIPCDRVVINTLNPDGQSYTERFSSGIHVESRMPGSVIQLEGTFTRAVIEHGGPLVLNVGRAEHPRRLLERYPGLRPAIEAGIRSFLTAPMVSEGRVIGTVHVRSRSQFAFRPKHEALIQQIASFAASAVEKADLLQRIERESRERQILAEIGRIIGSAFDFADAFEPLARLVSDLIPADRIAVTTLNADRTAYEIRFAWGVEVPSHGPGNVVELAGTMSEAAIGSNGPTIAHLCGATESADLLARYPVIKPAVDEGICSLIATPIITEGHIIGSFHVQSRQKNAYKPEHESLIQQIAAYVASAVAKSDLLHRVERESRQRQILAEIGRLIGSALDFGDVFEPVAEQVRKLIPADRIVVTTVDQESEMITDRYVWGPRLPIWDAEESRSIKGLPTERVVKEARAIIVSLEEADSEFERAEGMEESRTQGLRSAMFAPLISSDRVIGTISVKSSLTRAYEQADLEVIQEIAQQIAGAVVSSDLYLETVRLADERDKRRHAESENRELQRVNQAKSDFLSTVSHELKTPLTSILAFTGVLQKNRNGDLGERDIKQLAVIKRNGERLDRLISDLVDVSRLEANTISLNRSQFNLIKAVTDLIESFEPVLDRKSQSITLAGKETDLEVFADADRVIQVISNLISNASKYSPPGTEIGVKIEIADQMVLISVSDQGIGVSDEDQQNLFTAFFRADNQMTRTEPGTGLGLVIAKSIAELHGGALTVESKIDAGSTFTFSLPVESDAAGAHSA